MSILYIVEHDYQVRNILEMENETKAKWIAVGPSAMHCLSAENIPYSIPEDYCSREEIGKAGEVQYERIKTACRQIDSLLLKADPFLMEWHIRPLFFHLWQIGQLIDILLSRALQLQSIIRCFPQSRICVHKGQDHAWSLFSIGFSSKENLWGRLLALPEWEAPICFFPDPISDVRRKQNPEFGGKSLRHIIARSFFISRLNPRWRSILRSLRWNRKGNIINLLRNGHSNKRSGIVIWKGPYEWESILSALISKGNRIHFLDRNDFLENLPSLEHEIYHADLSDALWENFKEALSKQPVDFSPIIESRIRSVIKGSSAAAKNAITKIASFFSEYHICLFLTSVGFDYFSFIIKQYCRAKNIPVLCWQHGAVWYDQNITQRTDLLNMVSCDKLLVAGDAVKKGYEAIPLALEEHCSVVSAGLPSLNSSRTISALPSHKKVRILWPCGGYYGNSWYCGFSPPQSDTIYFKEQIIIRRNLIDLISEYSHISLTIKLYPSRNPMDNPPWVKEIKPEMRVRIVHQRPTFRQLLKKHDLVLIDSPTTILLQAIATRLPVFVLMSVIRWPADAVSLLAKRAVCRDSAQSLMDVVKRSVMENDYCMDVGNEEFIQLYGTHRRNGSEIALTIANSVLYH